MTNTTGAKVGELNPIVYGNGRPANAAERLRERANEVNQIIIKDAKARITKKMEQAASSGEFGTVVYIGDSEKTHVKNILEWLQNEGITATYHNPDNTTPSSKHMGFSINPVEKHMIRLEW